MNPVIQVDFRPVIIELAWRAFSLKYLHELKLRFRWYSDGADWFDTIGKPDTMCNAYIRHNWLSMGSGANPRHYANVCEDYPDFEWPFPYLGRYPNLTWPFPEPNPRSGSSGVDYEFVYMDDVTICPTCQRAQPYRTYEQATEAQDEWANAHKVKAHPYDRQGTLPIEFTSEKLRDAIAQRRNKPEFTMAFCGGRWCAALRPHPGQSGAALAHQINDKIVGIT